MVLESEVRKGRVGDTVVSLNAVNLYNSNLLSLINGSLSNVGNSLLKGDKVSFTKFVLNKGLLIIGPYPVLKDSYKDFLDDRGSSTEGFIRDRSVDPLALIINSPKSILLPVLILM